MKTFFCSMLVAVSILIGCSKSSEEPKVMEQQEPESPIRTESPTTPNDVPNITTASIANDPPNAMRQRVVKRFEKWFGNIEGQAALPIKKAHIAWREMWLAHYNDPVASASNSRVNQGLDLPFEINDFKSPSKPYFVQMREGRFELAHDDEEIESLSCLHMLMIGVMVGGGRQLPDLLSDRIDALPPSVGDLHVLQMVRESIQLRQQTNIPMIEAQRDAWEQMSTSHNPIYRNIALTIYPRIGASNDQILEFYQKCENETDSHNLITIVSNVEALPNGLGRAYLERLQTQIDRQRSPAVATAISDALDNLKQRGN